MRRHRLGTMKFLKQLIITFVASCVLAVGAMAVEPQKNDPKPPPPPKEKQDVPKPPKESPPPRNDNGNKGGNQGKKGGKP
jgi:hypothetical protein